MKFHQAYPVRSDTLSAMTTFVLVHGAWHGAWCWDKVRPELESRGHQVIAVNLPVDDRDAGIRAYRDLVERSLADGRDDLVAVGHSMGGLVVPYVARDVGARHCVYVTAATPVPGKSFLQDSMEETDGNPPGFTMRDDGAAVWTLEAAIDYFYADCAREDAEWAFSKLRPQYWTPGLEPAEDIDLRAIPSTYVACREDRIIPFERGKRYASERLGVGAVEMDGSHSPFLSRPSELAAVLLNV